MTDSGAELEHYVDRATARSRVWLSGVLVAACELGVVWQRLTAAERSARSLLALAAELLGCCSIVACFVWLSWSLGARAWNSGAPRRRNSMDRLAALLFVAPFAVGGGRALLLVLLRRFHNQELATLLATCVLLGVGALCWPGVAALTAVCERARGRWPHFGRWSLLPGALVSFASSVSLLRGAGLEQLDRALLLAPTAVLCVALVPRRALAPWHRLTRSWRSAALLVVGLAMALGGGGLLPAASAVLAGRGGWSRPLIALLRTVTDFDGDGYSAWFSGGDCAPFDARVHPGAREVPGDGVDNNCVAGDAPLRAPRVLVEPRAGGLAHGKNLILITIETLRADHTSLLGYARRTTPELESLAATSFVFETTYAPTPTTRLSLTALLSGVMPSKVRWIAQAPARQMRHIAPETPWLPELLAQHGYETIAVHTDFRAFTAAENAGFDRGFRRYDTTTRLSYSGGTMRGFPGETQVSRALSLLDARRAEPFFLWLHLVEPHYVYERSAAVPDFGSDERALYDADIAEADRQLGRLLRGLAERGLLERSVLFVSGDHGEEFGEHGERWHGTNLYEPQLRTVSVLRVPGTAPRRLNDAVSLLDAAPTLLDLLGIDEGAAGMMGRDLVPLLLDRRELDPLLLLENFRVDSGARALYGYVDRGEKCLFNAESGRFELFDVRADPAERSDLFLDGEPRSERCRTLLSRSMESSAPSNGAAAR